MEDANKRWEQRLLYCSSTSCPSVEEGLLQGERTENGHVRWTWGGGGEGVGGALTTAGTVVRAQMGPDARVGLGPGSCSSLKATCLEETGLKNAAWFWSPLLAFHFRGPPVWLSPWIRSSTFFPPSEKLAFDKLALNIRMQLTIKSHYFLPVLPSM